MITVCGVAVDINVDGEHYAMMVYYPPGRDAIIKVQSLRRVVGP